MFLQIGEILRESKNGKIRSRRVATGNWGCGKQCGDVQFKFILQWMASSLAGVKMIYHTGKNDKLSKVGFLRNNIVDLQY